MPEDDAFWDFYWEMRLQPMENLGKREAILAGSKLIRRLSQQVGRPLRILELGCGEAQVVGALMDAHTNLCDRQVVVGVDYNARSLARCRKDFSGLRFVEGDFTDAALLAGLGTYDVVIFVNALHEVYSSEYSPELGQVDIPVAKGRVEDALGKAVQLLEPRGWLVLFDGLEPPGDPDDILSIRFQDQQARDHFETFVGQYQPFQIEYQQSSDPLCVDLPRRYFVRYIDKSIFLGKALWQTERLESYQYFTEEEFRNAIQHQQLRIAELRTLTVNEEKWRRQVQIETPGEDFPQEHILILAQRKEEQEQLTADDRK